MAETNGERSQEATPHRRQQAREQGQLAKSQDLASAVLLLAGIVALMWLGGSLVEFFARLTRQQLGGEAWLAADAPFLTAQYHTVIWGLAKVLLPILGGLLLLGIAANVLQTGLLFLPEKLAPDLTRIDPLGGLRRLFSLASFARLGLGFGKIVVIGAVAYVCVLQELDVLLSLAGLALPELAVTLTRLVLWTSLKMALALMVLAVLDYAFQWWRHEQDLKMTPQEVREEMKNLQGDPQTIARRRQVHRQLILHRLSQAVPKADVVISNPTELAIAIQYDPETMAAPLLVAKGAGLVAQRIRRLALEHGIPIIERKPLAQALYKEVELNRPIPHQMYAAVAEVLAFVYQLKGKSVHKPQG